jgi:hypothetical protein
MARPSTLGRITNLPVDRLREALQRASTPLVRSSPQRNFKFKIVLGALAAVTAIAIARRRSKRSLRVRDPSDPDEVARALLARYADHADRR